MYHSPRVTQLYQFLLTIPDYIVDKTAKYKPYIIQPDYSYTQKKTNGQCTHY